MLQWGEGGTGTPPPSPAAPNGGAAEHGKGEGMTKMLKKLWDLLENAYILLLFLFILVVLAGKDLISPEEEDPEDR